MLISTVAGTTSVAAGVCGHTKSRESLETMAEPYPYHAMDLFTSTPAPVVSDHWRDAKIEKLARENDALRNRQLNVGLYVYVMPRLLRDIRKEASRRSRNLRARIGREIARSQKTPDVELAGGKFVVGKLRRVPSGAILDYEAEE